MGPAKNRLRLRSSSSNNAYNYFLEVPDVKSPTNPKFQRGKSPSRSSDDLSSCTRYKEEGPHQVSEAGESCENVNNNCSRLTQPAWQKHLWLLLFLIGIAAYFLIIICYKEIFVKKKSTWEKAIDYLLP